MTLLTARKNIHYIYSSYICTGMQRDSTKLKKVLNGGKRNQIDARWNFKLEPFSIATINHFNPNLSVQSLHVSDQNYTPAINQSNLAVKNICNSCQERIGFALTWLVGKTSSSLRLDEVCDTSFSKKENWGNRKSLSIFLIPL